MQNLAETCSNIKIITLTKNTGGPVIPRNKAIEVATSKYIMFLDYDDRYENNACEILYNTITQYDADMVSCRYYINDYNHINRSFLDNYENVVEIDSIKEFPKIIYTAANTTIWNKIYKKDLLIENNIYFKEDMLPEDLIFTTQCYCKSNKTILLNKGLYNYSVTSDSLSKKFNKDVTTTFIDGYTFLKEYLIKEKLYNKDILGEYIIAELRAVLYSSTTNKENKELLRMIKPILKDYSIRTRLVNNVSMPLNIIINIFVKLSAITIYIPLLVRKILNLENKYKNK